MKSRINVPTVPLDEAIARVTRFRDQLIKQVPEANIPRAVFIPIADIMAIIEKFQELDEHGNIRNSLTGVRAYFAVKDGDQALPDDVTALIVPVDLAGSDIVAHTTGVEGEEDDDSDIYDFTQPCPDKCDPDSPLYV
ncbi:hypothetical protein [Pedobacter xixiisoli]|uniref:Uncharacterized protein n=1 Tax=Pedobacter xixiisoli TaxID=1476464 RepID=A0A285ZRA1_9SPHI|nr:hypothetical protein [Pedobacter xixiisoli]SOD12175.1 hypothetical protein SAMN06297358_0532 [Pedobacter xixiisoli]